MNTQTNRQPYRQTDRQAGRQTDRQTDRQTHSSQYFKRDKVTRAQQQMRWATVDIIDMGRKYGGLLCPFCGGAGSPSNTLWPGPRSTSIPSGIFIHPAVWPQYTNVSDRTDRQTDATPAMECSIDIIYVREHMANRFTNGGPEMRRRP